MTKVLKIALAGAALLTSASLVSAQDRPAQDSSKMANSQSQLPTGRYVAPAKKPQPQGPVRPFTWEEKRFFDMTNGEEG
jgi:hypothetical protein